MSPRGELERIRTNVFIYAEVETGTIAENGGQIVRPYKSEM